MKRWQRSALTWCFMVLLLTAMYRKMVALGFSDHWMLLWYGGLAVLAALGQFLLKPDEKFAELTGLSTSMRARMISGTTFLLLGTALIVWATLYVPISK